MAQEQYSSDPARDLEHIDGDASERAFEASEHDGQEGSWLTPGLLAVTRVVLRFPIFTLALAIGISAACGLYAFWHLGYKTNRLDLLNPKSDHNRLWIDYVKEFGDEDDAVIVVEGANRDQVVPVLEELSTALGREKRLFHAVLHEVDLSKIRSKGLHYLPTEQLQAINQLLDWAVPVVNGDWSRLQIAKLVGASAGMQPSPAGSPPVDFSTAIERLDRIVTGLLAEFGPQSHYESPLPSMSGDLAELGQLGTEYLVFKQGRMGLVLLRISVAKDELARGSEAVHSLRELVAATELRHPGVKIGLTGLPIMENDEMESSQSSMLWGSILSLIGVVIVVIAGFGGVRHALLANIVLLIGTGWAFGYATIAVGHLNILSITFTATLIGVGIDYGTYYVSRYLQYRREGTNCEQSLLKTTKVAGPAILTGAMTTVVAFFATGMTSFRGIAELGIIAGGGILLCALAQLFVLPALVRVVDESRMGDRLPKPVPIHAGVRVLMKAPRLIMVIAVIFTISTGWGAHRLWYDYNLLNMQPEGQESVQLEKRLLSECEQSAWYALSYSDDRKELLERKAKFLKLPSVERTEEIASLLTTDDDAKHPIIVNISDRLANLPERPPLIAVDPLEELGAVLGTTQELLQRDPKAVVCARHIEQLRDAMRRLPASDCYAKLSQFQQQVAGDLLSRLHVLRSVANPEPPQLTDLSSSLVSRFVGQNGKFLLKIYGRGDIWNMDELTRFVKDVRSVDPNVTGNPLQTYECSLEMLYSYKMATILSVLVIFGVLYIDFRNLTHCALAAIPQFMGIAVTFGLLGYMNSPLNPANLIAVPIILGIGVDYSVYIVHEFLEQKGRYRMSPGTAVAVMVDSLTTLIGYGSLLIATHRGLQSLGRVLTIAVTFCTLMSVIALPAFLTWITRKRPLVPWVGDAVISYDHEQEVDIDDGNFPATRRAA